MYQIDNLYSNLWNRDYKNFPGIISEIVTPKDATWLEDYKESFSFYAFTLVLSGSIKIKYDKEIIELRKEIFHLYLPGSEFSVIEVSEDYKAICVIADEGFIMDLDCMEKLLVITYSPSLLKLKGYLKLSKEESERMISIFSLLDNYSRSDLKYKNECIKEAFSTLIYDLTGVLELKKRFRTTTENLEGIFFKFFQLLKENFRTQHEIRFYSDKLGITSEYLSRIVRKISGKTVMSFLNRMLVIEASWKLIHSEMSMSELAKHLNFSTSASLSKFFKTQKGLSPLKYRKAHKRLLMTGK